MTEPVAGHAIGAPTRYEVEHYAESYRRFAITCECGWKGDGYYSVRNAKIAHARHLQMVRGKAPEAVVGHAPE